MKIEKIEIVAGSFVMTKNSIKYTNLIFNNAKYNIEYFRNLCVGTFDFTKKLNEKIHNFLNSAVECPSNFNPLEPNSLVLVNPKYVKDISIQQNHIHKFEKTARCDIYFRQKIISEFIKFSTAYKWLELLKEDVGQSNSKTN